MSRDVARWREHLKQIDAKDSESLRAQFEKWMARATFPDGTMPSTTKLLMWLAYKAGMEEAARIGDALGHKYLYGPQIADIIREKLSRLS